MSMKHQTYTRSASLRWHRYLTREATLSACGMARRRYGDARRVEVPEGGEMCRLCLGSREGLPGKKGNWHNNAGRPA